MVEGTDAGRWRARLLVGLLVLPLMVLTSNDYQGGDAHSYRDIALAAPGLPARELPYHHAQRLGIPYLFGALAHACGLDALAVLQVAALLVLVGNVALLAALCDQLGATRSATHLALALFVFNPYVFRYYLCTPPMLNDSGFVLGMLWLASGLHTGRLTRLIAGTALAALARQTALLLVPVALVWLVVGRRWRGARRLAAALVLLLIPLTIYLVTGRVAREFSGPTRNLEHIVGVVHWLLGAFDARVLALFSARLALTFAMIAAVSAALLAREGRGVWSRCPHRPEVLLLGLLALAVLSQPLLAGPALSLKDIQRLAGLAVAPLLVAGAGLFEVRLGRRALGLSAGLLFAGSLHHLFSFYGPRPDLKAVFALAHGALAVLVGLVVYRGSRTPAAA